MAMVMSGEQPVREKDLTLGVCRLAVPCSKAICGGDGFARDFGRGRHENLSGAISWFTFLTG
jgi:hypothetical protein